MTIAENLDYYLSERDAAVDSRNWERAELFNNPILDITYEGMFRAPARNQSVDCYMAFQHAVCILRSLQDIKSQRNVKEKIK